VNPNTSTGRIYGTKTDYPDFEKFIVMTEDYMDCTCFWMDITKGIGTRSALAGSAPIARGKVAKLYHNLLDQVTPLDTGESIFYEGTATIFSNLGDPGDDTFAYYQ